VRSEARALALLLVATSVALVLAFQVRGELFFDLGPNDRRYTSGFREDYEVEEPTMIHWTTTTSAIRLPFSIHGPYEVVIRHKRHVASETEVRFFLAGEQVATENLPQHDFRLTHLRSETDSLRPLTLSMVASSKDPRPLGLALDWIAVRRAPGGARSLLFPNAAAALALLVWVTVLYAFPRVLSFSPRLSLLVASLGAAALVAAAAWNPLWPVHAALTIGWRAHAFAFGLLAIFHAAWRKGKDASREARWAFLLVYVATAVRLFALFHPDFFYPDIRTHSKFVSLIWTEGLHGFFTDFIANQHRHLLGLQLVDGKWLAFPYPPLLYLSIYPLSLLQLPVEEWMLLVPTFFVGVEALLVFSLGRRLGLAGRSAAFAATLHATARVVAFRLAVASFAALLGHFLDLVAIYYLVTFHDRIEKPRHAMVFGTLVAVALLSYAGSALVLGLFVPILTLTWFLSRADRPSHMRKRVAVVLVAAFAGAVLSIGTFYLQYVPELQPILLGTSNGSETGGIDAGGTGVARARARASGIGFTPFAALTMAVRRVNLFYGPGWIFGLATLFALPFVRTRFRHPLATPLLVATLGTYLGLNFLRAGLGPVRIFQFTKDDLVILPLVALVLAALVDRVWNSRPVLACALVVAWVGVGAWGMSRDVRARFIHPEYPLQGGSTDTGRTGSFEEENRNGSGGQHDLVAAGSLRLIEGFVRELEELGFVTGVGRERAQAETGRNPLLQARVGLTPEPLSDGLTQCARDTDAVVHVRPVK
jgi:hypothetical protein